MKILHVVPGLRRTGGGVSECVPELCRALHALGHEVGIAVCEPDSVSDPALAAEREGVRIHRFGGNIGWKNPILFSGDLLRGLAKVMRVYDIVHLNSDWLFPTWWGARVARKLGKPYVHSPHGSFIPGSLLVSPWKKRLAGFLFDRSVVRHASAVFATSGKEMEAIRAYAPTARTVLVPCAIDLSGAEGGKLEKSQAKAKHEGERRTLLFFSRISYVKGLDMLAEAWEKIGVGVGSRRSDWKLVIVGPDDRGYAEEIKRVFAAKCPEGSYEFRGPAYGVEKWRLLAEADAFVLPTRNENFGIVVAEAMASGLPVVCTKGAPWECLETEQAGRWVDVSAEGIQKGIEDVLALSDEERRAMGERGRRWTEENLGKSVIARKTVECYSSVLGLSSGEAEA